MRGRSRIGIGEFVHPARRSHRQARELQNAGRTVGFGARTLRVGASTGIACCVSTGCGEGSTGACRTGGVRCQTLVAARENAALWCCGGHDNDSTWPPIPGASDLRSRQVQHSTPAEAPRWPEQRAHRRREHPRIPVPPRSGLWAQSIPGLQQIPARWHRRLQDQPKLGSGLGLDFEFRFPCRTRRRRTVALVCT